MCRSPKPGAEHGGDGSEHSMSAHTESFLLWPACPENRHACQGPQASRPELRPALYSELPPHPTRLNHTGKVSLPLVLVPFGYISICAQCLPNPLPSSCLPFCLLLWRGREGALKSSCSLPRSVGVEVVAGLRAFCRTRSHYYLVYGQPEQCFCSFLGKC